MNFLSNILTIALISLFTLTATATTSNSPIDEGKEKKETVVKDENTKEDTDETTESSLTNLELTSDIINKAKPAQLETQNTNTTILPDLSINDKIEHSPKLN